MKEIEKDSQKVEDREDYSDNEKNNLTKVTCLKEENKNEIEKNLEEIFSDRMRTGEMIGRKRKKKKGKLDYLIRYHNA